MSSKRVLSMFLVLCMVLVALPVFALPSMAAGADEDGANLGTFSTKLDMQNNWPVIVDNGEDAGNARWSFTEWFGDNWTFGVVLDGAFVPATKFESGWATLGYANVWQNGGVYLNTGSIIGNTNAIPGFGWVAPYTGTVDLSAAFTVSKDAAVNFAITVNNQIVYPAQPTEEGAAAVWEDLPAGEYAKDVKNVSVQAGQYIAFLFQVDGTEHENYVASAPSFSIAYTSVASGNTANYVSDLAQLQNADNVQNAFAYNDNSMVLGASAWSVGGFDKDNVYADFAFRNEAWWACSELGMQNLWQAYGGGYQFSTRAVTPTEVGTSVAIVYTAEFDGILKPSMSQWMSMDFQAPEATYQLILMKNDEVIWPENCTSPIDSENAYTVTRDAEDPDHKGSADPESVAAVLAEINEAIADVSIEVKKGDQIRFVVHRPGAYALIQMLPAVTYTSFAYDTPVAIRFSDPTTGEVSTTFMAPGVAEIVPPAVEAEDFLGWYEMTAAGEYITAEAYNGTMLAENKTFYAIYRDSEFSPSTNFPVGDTTGFYGYRGSWTVGAYAAGSPATYSMYSNYDIANRIVNAADTWTSGGVYLESGRYITCNGYAVTLTWRALVGGTVDLDFTRLSIDSGMDLATRSDINIAIVKNGTIIWPAAAAGEPVAFADSTKLETWFYGDLGEADPDNGTYENNGTHTVQNIGSILEQYEAYCKDNSDYPHGIEVAAGDTVQIVMKRVGGPHITAYPVITYTEVDPEGVLWDGIVTELDYKYSSTFNSTTNLPSDQGIDTPAGGVVFNGGWSYVGYPATSNAPENGYLLNTVTNTTAAEHDWFYTAQQCPGGLWDVNYPAIRRTSGSPQWGPAGTVTVTPTATGGLRYTAPYTGIVNLNFDSLKALTDPEGKVVPATLHVAAFLNGEMIWPTAGGDYTDAADWFQFPDSNEQAATVMADAEQKAMLSSLYVKAGDNIEVLVKTTSTVSDAKWCSRGTTVFMTVTYTDILTAAPEVEAAVTVGENFAMHLYATIPEGLAVTEPTLEVNGEPLAMTWDDGAGAYIASITGIAAREVADTFSWKLTGVLNDRTVTLDAGESSVADCMMAVAASHADYANLVYATLNYCAAAQVYFDYNTANLANAAMTDAQKVVPAVNPVNALENTALSGATAEITGFSLLMQDSVVLKVFVAAEDATDLSLKLSVSVQDETYSQELPLEACDGGDGYKAFLPVPLGAYGRELTFTVVNAEGEAVSNTVVYSVESYAARMGNGVAADLLKALVAMNDAMKAIMA